MNQLLRMQHAVVRRHHQYQRTRMTGAVAATAAAFVSATVWFEKQEQQQQQAEEEEKEELVHSNNSSSSSSSSCCCRYGDNHQQASSKLLCRDESPTRPSFSGFSSASASAASASLAPLWNDKSAAVIVTTSCDAATLLGQEPRQQTFRKPRTKLRRQATIDKLEETAEQDSIESKYNILWRQPLGEGAFGAVYPAFDKKTGERVAVKKIYKRYTNNATFQREMDALLLLRECHGHPNICGLRDNFVEGEFYYLVLDLVNGGELFEQLCDYGPYSEADAAWHIQEVTSALAFLHGIGIIHADIKPENIMLSSKNEADAVVKIVDFGCAHLQNHAPWLDHIPKGTGAATPAYCPPEVLLAMQKNKNYHPDMQPSFDMFSLGCVIYTMLVGAHPFDLNADSTNAEIEARVISGEKPPLRDLDFCPELSDDAIEVIEGLLEFDPNKRWTAEQVLEHPWVHGETASSKKIQNSDKRLASAYRKHKTRILSTFFKTLLSNSDTIRTRKTSERTSLLESAFRRLDRDGRGYLSTDDMPHGKQQQTDSNQEEDETLELSLSDVSALLAENMKNRYFPKGHIIYNEGDSGHAMFLIDSGTVESTCKDGFQKVRKSGELVGVGSLMNASKTHHSTAKCLTPVHAIEISRELFDRYVSSDSETFLSMAETDRHRKRERANALLLQAHKKHSYPQSFRKNETVFASGDKGKHLYLLEQGEMSISVNGHKVRSLQPGEVAGEHAAFLGKPYNVTAECESKNCHVLALPAEVMHRLFRSDPALKKDFRDLLLRRDFKKALCAEIKKAFPNTEEEIRAAFEAIDVDGSGSVNYEELRLLVQKFDPSYSEGDIRDMMESLDLNKSGSMTWDEFNRIFSMDKET